jgi:hypothetical protein
MATTQHDCTQSNYQQTMLNQLQRTSRYATSSLAILAATTIATAQSNTTSVPTQQVSHPSKVTQVFGASCINGMTGDTTIAGGWTAFEAASGKTMEVLNSGVADFTDIFDIGSSLGNLTLSTSFNRRTIGASWGTWSHGYTGEIFWSNGDLTETITMPAGTTAFDAYVEPNPFALHTFDAVGTCSDGSTLALQFTADGTSGASHFGFWTEGTTNTITSVQITGTADWAIGEWRVSGDGGTGGGIGTPYCTSLPNSTGGAAVISAAGSDSISTNNFTLTAEPVPNQPFIFFMGTNQLDVPFGDGRLCAGGTITRFYPPAVATGNKAERMIDLPTELGGAMSGNFQCWFRDPAAAGTGFNTSNGLDVTFTP